MKIWYKTDCHNVVKELSLPIAISPELVNKFLYFGCILGNNYQNLIHVCRVFILEESHWDTSNEYRVPYQMFLSRTTGKIFTYFTKNLI